MKCDCGKDLHYGICTNEVIVYSPHEGTTLSVTADNSSTVLTRYQINHARRPNWLFLLRDDFNVRYGDY